MSAESNALAAREQEELVSQLCKLSDSDARREFFHAHPAYFTRHTIERLVSEITQLVRVDLLSAESLALTALWLADELDDDYGRGRSQRVAANVAHFKGEHVTASGLYHSALSSFQKIADDREVAITRSSALQNLVFNGRYQQAFEWAIEARKVFEKLGDRLRLARLELNFGNILFRQDRWEEAAERYRLAYEEFVTIGEPQDVATSLRNMAVCHSSLNNFRQALKLYERARVFCIDSNLPVFVVELDYNIAYLHYLRGEYTTAIELYRTARSLCEKIGERYHMALCDLDQAEIFLELNLVEESAELAQDAFASFDELGVSYESAKALAFMAIAVSRQGKDFLALELLANAREIFVREENQIWPALIDLYRALVIYRAGRPLEAARLARGALQVFSVASLPTKTAICEILLARLHFESGEYQQARGRCETALLILRKLDVSALSYQAHFVLGQVEEAVGKRSLALDSYRSSQNSLEELRSHLQTEELKIGFLKNKLLVYESLVALLLQGEMSVVEKQEVFSCFEKAKSRSLADMMAFRAHALPLTGAARSEQAGQVRKLREELNWYYRQIDLQEMRGGDRSSAEVENLRESSRRREDHLLRTLRELQASDQEFSSLQEGATVDVQSIQASLSEDEILVEYYVARGVIFVCLLGRELLEIVPVTIASRAREIHRLLQFQLSKFSLGSDYVKEFADLIDEATMTQLKELYRELISPLVGRLDCRRLVIVPHDFLHYVPFHALHDGEAFMIDRYAISYAPSASSYYLSCAKEVQPDGSSLVLAIADGQRQEVLEEGLVASEALPDSRIFVEGEATEQNLRDFGRKSRFLYVATHGFFRRDNPMFSAIQLGGTRLNLFDLYNLKLEAELVVLSGCGAEFGQGKGGDELVGLTRGLLYAGAQSVLVNLWDVRGRSTHLFAQALLRRVSEGASKVDSVREAIFEVRRDYPHPFYWASFVLVGKP